MTSSRSTKSLAVCSFAVSSIGLAVCVALASERLRGLLLNSSLLATGTLAVSLPLGILLAVAVTKTSMPGRRWVEGLLVSLLFIPLYVHATAWQAALGYGGWLTTLGTNKGESSIWFTGWTASVWAHGFSAVPWVVLFVAAALRTIRPELEEESLQDASSWRVLSWVSMRGAVAGMVAAALWIAVICFGEIAVTDLFQIRTFAEEIYTAASFGVLAEPVVGGREFNDVPQLVANDLWVGTGIVMALVLAALASVWSWLPATDSVSTSADWIWDLGSGRWGVAIVVVLILIGMVGVPAASLVSKAGATTERVEAEIVRGWSAKKSGQMVVNSFWEHRREWGWTLAIGVAAVVAATLVGGVLAWALRMGSFPVLPMTALLALGFSIPGPLLAVWLIRILNQPDDSILWPLGWCYRHTILAPTLVQFLRALPLTTLLLWSQFASVSQDVLDSATSEGAGWCQQLFRIVVPLRWTAVVAAVGMAMIVAMSDLAATLLVAPPGVTTLSMRIFGLLHYGAEDRVSALCLAIAVTVGLVMGAILVVAAPADRRSSAEGTRAHEL